MCAAINVWCGLRHCTEVHFATFHSGGFITVIVSNSQERKLTKCTSVQWLDLVTVRKSDLKWTDQFAGCLVREKPGLFDH